VNQSSTTPHSAFALLLRPPSSHRSFQSWRQSGNLAGTTLGVSAPSPIHYSLPHRSGDESAFYPIRHTAPRSGFASSLLRPRLTAPTKCPLPPPERSDSHQPLLAMVFSNYCGWSGSPPSYLRPFLNKYLDCVSYAPTPLFKAFFLFPPRAYPYLSCHSCGYGLFPPFMIVTGLFAPVSCSLLCIGSANFIFFHPYPLQPLTCTSILRAPISLV